MRTSQSLYHCLRLEAASCHGPRARFWHCALCLSGVAVGWTPSGAPTLQLPYLGDVAIPVGAPSIKTLARSCAPR